MAAIALAVLLVPVCGLSWAASTPSAGVDAVAPGGASWDSTSPSGAVIVIARPGSVSRAERAVRRLGGEIRMRLAIINGFSATLPEDKRETLEQLPFVVSVTGDTRMQALGAAYSPADDLSSMYSVTLMTGAQAYWRAGFTGKGVDVAVIDSGIAPVDGLAVPGKVVNGADLSFESQASNLRYLDTFGHGTHMAGIIAGRANGAVSGRYVNDTTNFLGMAPDARVVSVKVADAHGATDVSQVIAAIDWVVQHRSDNGLNIRVLNLSYGTNSAQDPLVDPLVYAAERAWEAGIVVVTAAGNAGFFSNKTGSLTNPARSPNLLAVGAADPMGTAALKDDKVPAFSSRGSTARRVDLVAPGSHVVSLRVPGSLIDQSFSATGAVTNSLFRGSGSSQAAAVVSGAAALVIQQRPSITPGQLKALLMGTAQRLGEPMEAMGKGELNLAKTFKTSTPSAASFRAGRGGGSLDLARGSVRLVKDGVPLQGEVDIFGMAFDSTAISGLQATGSSWSGGNWNGSSWSGSSWSGSSWSGSSWSGSSWSGSSWSSVLWSGSSWSGSSWSGSSWSGNVWLDSVWASNVWSDAFWG